MILYDVWNNTYNNQLVLIRAGENEIFLGVIGDVPMEIMDYHVLWIKSAEDCLIIDTLRSDNMTVVDESTESSTSNTDDDALAPIKNLIDTLNRDELLEVKVYIEKRL